MPTICKNILLFEVSSLFTLQNVLVFYISCLFTFEKFVYTSKHFGTDVRCLFTFQRFLYHASFLFTFPNVFTSWQLFVYILKRFGIMSAVCLHYKTSRYCSAVCLHLKTFWVFLSSLFTLENVLLLVSAVCLHLKTFCNYFTMKIKKSKKKGILMTTTLSLVVKNLSNKLFTYTYK